MGTHVRKVVTNIHEFSTIPGRKINMIHEFIKTLSYKVQSLKKNWVDCLSACHWSGVS